MASPNLVTGVRKAVKAMHWLETSDQATVDLAVRYAKDIEAAAASGDPAYTSKVLATTGRELMATLKALGGTPAERRALGAESEAKGRLAEIRALRSAQ